MEDKIKELGKMIFEFKNFIRDSEQRLNETHLNILCSIESKRQIMEAEIYCKLRDEFKNTLSKKKWWKLQ